MHRIDGPGALPGGQFTEGDPNVGTPATVVTDDWLNALQEEVAGVVEATGVALAKPDNGQLLAAVRWLIAQAMPPGAVQAFARSTAPAGWLKCDGAVVSRSAYPALFAVVGTTFGAGDGSTTFGLPDLRGEFIRGWDDGRGVDSGRGLGSAQADEIKSHTHTIDTSGTDASGAGYIADASAPNVNQAATLAAGGAETRPRNVAMLYCIKA